MNNGPDDKQAPIYIYNAMDRNVGYGILRTRAQALIHLPEIKLSGKLIWLLRESNTQKGMLTADYIRWDNEKNVWLGASIRVVLHKEKGWINASNTETPDVKEAIKRMESVDANIAAGHLDSLSQFLEKSHLITSNRLNPSQVEQSKQPIYTAYISDVANDDGKPKKVMVSLPPAVLQAITCELTGKPMQDPVVLKADINIRREDGGVMTLKKGRSYERAALEMLNVEKSIYISNFTLKKVIGRLGCSDQGIINSLEAERLLDPVQLETMSDPYIMPSGHSISKETLDGMVKSNRTLKCPETNLPFGKSDAVPNTNLDRFIKAWPSCRETLLESLKSEPSSSSKIAKL